MRNKNEISGSKLLAIVLIFVLVLWIILPPRNKIAQVGYCFSNIVEWFGGHRNEPEWKFYRNNATYLYSMNKKQSIQEMDKAIASVPAEMSDAELGLLYRDRALLKLYFGDYKSALDDYIKVEKPDLPDLLKIALLFKVNGNNKFALQYCNKILDIDHLAYAGYACLADVYSNAGRNDVSVRVYDLLISRSANKAKYYMDRGNYRVKAGDPIGAKEDFTKAEELRPGITKSEEPDIIYNTLHPRSIDFKIMK